MSRQSSETIILPQESTTELCSKSMDLWSSWTMSSSPNTPRLSMWFWETGRSEGVRFWRSTERRLWFRSSRELQGLIILTPMWSSLGRFLRCLFPRKCSEGCSMGQVLRSIMVLRSLPRIFLIYKECLSILITEFTLRK